MIVIISAVITGATCYFKTSDVTERHNTRHEEKLESCAVIKTRNTL